MSDKPWEDPQDKSREAVLGRLLETQTEQIEAQRKEINLLHAILTEISRISTPTTGHTGMAGDGPRFVWWPPEATKEQVLALIKEK